MRTFTLSPLVKAWFDTVVNLHPDAPAPPLPPPSSNPEEQAFHAAVLVPIATLKGAVIQAMPPPAPVIDTYAIDPNTGQPLHPEMWGTQAGSP